MKIQLWVIGAIVALVGGVAWPFVAPVRAQIVMADKMRFRLIGDEPIASGDGRSIVSGMKVIVLRDTKSDQCYVSFIMGAAMSTTGPSVCP